MSRKTKIGIAVVALVVVVGVVSVATTSRKPKGTPVRTAEVERKELVALVTANGTLQAATKVEISANIMGQITQLNVEEGDRVSKGDLLLVIDQVRYAAAVSSSRSSLQALEAELERAREAAAQARRDQQRVQQQFDEGIVPEAEAERARSVSEQAESSLRRAERQVAQAKADLSSTADALEKTEIRAPMDGVVTRRNIEQGEVVVTGTMNNPGTVLMTISDMATIEAVLEVDQTDVPALRVGQPATVAIDAFPGRPWPGVVSEIGSSPITGSSRLGGQATGTDYEVKVTLREHPELVRPGLTVTADITTATREAAVAVPIGALVIRQPEPTTSPSPSVTPAGNPTAAPATRREDIEGVYVVKDGEVSFRAVSTGIRGELDVEVTEGLEGGEEIVVGPFKALRDLKPGAKVVVDNREGPEARS